MSIDWQIDLRGESGLCDIWCHDCGHHHAHDYDGVCLGGFASAPGARCPCPFTHGIFSLRTGSLFVPFPYIPGNWACPTTGLHYSDCRCNRHRCGTCGRRPLQQFRSPDGMCRCFHAMRRARPA